MGTENEAYLDKESLKSLKFWHGIAEESLESLELSKNLAEIPEPFEFRAKNVVIHPLVVLRILTVGIAASSREFFDGGQF